MSKKKKNKRKILVQKYEKRNCNRTTVARKASENNAKHVEISSRVIADNEQTVYVFKRCIVAFFILIVSPKANLPVQIKGTRPIEPTAIAMIEFFTRHEFIKYVNTERIRRFEFWNSFKTVQISTCCRRFGSTNNRTSEMCWTNSEKKTKKYFKTIMYTE